MLSGKRVLILADDARDAAQVAPLLPPPGAALLVTSRRRFPLPGMGAIDLGTLPQGEAEALLLLICPRIAAHAAALATLCDGLPLALRVSAGLLANSPRTVPRYLEQLAAARLAALANPDGADPSVEASLLLSYDALDPAAQQALCRLCVFPASFDLAAPEAVLDAAGDGEALLEELVKRSLVEWDEATERYDLHDLVRVFGVARLADADAVRLRHARHYAAVARVAEQDRYLKGDVAGGLRLFDQERSQIEAGWSWALAHAGVAAADGLLHDYTDATAHIAELRFDTRRERIPRLEAALAAARRQGRRGAEGAWLGNLGIAHTSHLAKPMRRAATTSNNW